MADKYLRHIPTGTIYIWQAAYAQRADFEDYVPEPVAEPVVEETPKAKTKVTRKKAAVEPAPEPTPEPVLVDEAALSADASRNLP